MDTIASALNHPPLLIKIINKQRQEALSDYKFARKLGIKRALWRLTRVGLRPLSMTVLKATARTYRGEFDKDILEFLRSEDHDSTD